MPGAAQIFIEKLVGGFFVTRETDLTLSTTVRQVLRNDPERVGWLIVVTGGTTAQLAFNANITLATAILISGAGGTFSANVREDFTLTTVGVFGRVEAGNTTIHIIEVIRVSSPAE